MLRFAKPRSFITSATMRPGSPEGLEISAPRIGLTPVTGAQRNRSTHPAVESTSVSAMAQSPSPAPRSSITRGASTPVSSEWWPLTVPSATFSAAKSDVVPLRL